jgi:hypothetical protein
MQAGGRSASVRGDRSDIIRTGVVGKVSVQGECDHADE